MYRAILKQYSSKYVMKHIFKIWSSDARPPQWGLLWWLTSRCVSIILGNSSNLTTNLQFRLGEDTLLLHFFSNFTIFSHQSIELLNFIKFFGSFPYKSVSFHWLMHTYILMPTAVNLYFLKSKLTFEYKYNLKRYVKHN